MEYLSTVEDLRKLLEDLGMISTAEFTRIVSLNPGSYDVVTAIGQLLDSQRSGTNFGVLGLSPITPYQVERLDPTRRAGLACGNWLLHDEVGSGGMGAVLSALDRTAPRLVAIKFLVHDADADRFQQEWTTLARLSHPGLPIFHAAGTWAGGEFDKRPYFVMNYLDGQDLDQLAGTSLSEQTVLKWFREVVDILAYLHDLKFVHRDIKPRNIRRLSQSGRIVLMDLGLIKEPTADQRRDSQRLTRDGHIMGTIDFMAPEQCANTRAVTAAADIYSLGATLYALMSGLHLFTGTQEDRFRKIQFEPPPRLRDRRPECDAAFDELINQMLAKKPEDRPTTLQLRAWLSNKEDTVLLIRGGHSGGTNQGTSLAASFQLEQRLIEFNASVAIGLHRLEFVSSESLTIAGQHLEMALALWDTAIQGSRVAAPAHLIAFGNFLAAIASSLIQNASWDMLIRPAIQDSLVKLYVNMLVFTADCLTEEYLASTIDERISLTVLRQNIETRLADWAEALAGGTPHGSYLDRSLCVSLQGHYPVALNEVLGKFDRRIMDRFHNAIRLRIRLLAGASDRGESLYEFISNEAIPFWHDDEFDGRVTLDFATRTGECLSSLMEVIRPSTYQVLKAIPKALKSLWLDDPNIRLQIHQLWSDVTRKRLICQLTTITSDANRHPEYLARLQEVQTLLLGAIDIPWISLSPLLPAFLAVRIERTTRLTCSIVQVTRELIGIHFQVAAIAALDRNIGSAPLNLDDVSEHAMEKVIPIQFGKDGPLVELADCILEIPLPDGQVFVYGNLEPFRWGRGSTPPVTDVFVRGDAPEGNANTFASYLNQIYGLVATPAEKLCESP